jgi:hypothetical protein
MTDHLLGLRNKSASSICSHLLNTTRAMRNGADKIIPGFDNVYSTCVSCSLCRSHHRPYDKGDAPKVLSQYFRYGIRDTFMTRQITILSLLVSMLAVPCSARQVGAASLNDLRPFTGEWVGEGDGGPGQGSGAFSFSFDLQGKVLVRKNYADYPASKDRPAFRHDDLMIVYPDAGSKGIRAIYFDSESHVIEYSVTVSPDQKTLTFLSDALASAPRYRLVYTRVGDDSLTLEFDIAPPGKPDAFSKYIVAKLRRKPSGS